MLEATVFHIAQRASDNRHKNSLFLTKIYAMFLSYGNIYLLFSSISAEHLRTEEKIVCKTNIHKKQPLRDGRLGVKPSYLD